MPVRSLHCCAHCAVHVPVFLGTPSFLHSLTTVPKRNFSLSFSFAMIFSAAPILLLWLSLEAYSIPTQLPRIKIPLRVRSPLNGRSISELGAIAKYQRDVAMSKYARTSNRKRSTGYNLYVPFDQFAARAHSGWTGSSIKTMIPRAYRWLHWPLLLTRTQILWLARPGDATDVVQCLARHRLGVSGPCVSAGVDADTRIQRLLGSWKHVWI